MTSILKSLLAATFLGVLPAYAELTWDRSSIEHTAVYGETKTEIPFTFKNTGTRPVTLLKVEASCSCTTAEPEKTIYQPGEIGVIVVTFNHGDRRGIQEKEVRVTTSDAPLTPVTLTLKVTIPAGATISANRLTWVKGETPVEKVVALTIQLGSKVELEPLTSSQAKLFHAEIEYDAAAKGYLLKVRPLSTAGAVQCPLRIRVVDSARPVESGGLEARRRVSVHRTMLIVMLRID